MVTANGSAPAAPSQDFKPTAEIGQTGFRRFGGAVDEEFDPNLRGQRGAKKFEEMRRNDPDVGALLTAIDAAIASVEWTVEAGGETPADQDAASFLESCIDDMSHSWDDLISDVLTMFPFGFAPCEITYKLRQGSTARGDAAPSKFDDGRIGWRKISLRAQESVERWEFGDDGSVQGLWQQVLSRPSVFIPIDKVILFKTRRERGNPEGYSILRNAYRPYFMKSNLEEIEVISAERDMTGIPWIKPPVGAGADAKTAGLNILEKLKWDDQAGVYLPREGSEPHQQWEIGTMSSPGAPRVEINTVVQRHTASIARSALAQFIVIGQGEGRGGSYALVRDFRDLFHLAAKAYLDRVEDALNRFGVERLFKLNDFDNLTAVPRIVHGRMGQRDVAPLVEAVTKLVTLGMPVGVDDWDFMRSELEMPQGPELQEAPEVPLGPPAVPQQPPQPAPTEQPEDEEATQVSASERQRRRKPPAARV